jgi:hypothetical protein
MNVTRIVVRGTLLAAVIVSAFVATVAVCRFGGHDPITWATVSAAFAVIAAAISAWTSQRVVELQEDAQAPDLVPSIDVRSRYSLAQFRIVNRGKSPAYQIQLTWDLPLKDKNGKDIELGTKVPVPVLWPEENASILIGECNTFITTHPDTTCRGTITFADASGKRRSRHFTVSAEHERYALTYDQENLKTEYELQRLPRALEKIADEIRACRKT